MRIERLKGFARQLALEAIADGKRLSLNQIKKEAEKTKRWLKNEHLDPFLTQGTFKQIEKILKANNYKELY
jgi:hypothetical protein